MSARKISVRDSKERGNDDGWIRASDLARMGTCERQVRFRSLHGVREMHELRAAAERGLKAHTGFPREGFSVVTSSNRVVQDWGKYLGDITMSTTILDRLMHRSTLLEFEGNSYRLKEAAARIARAA
jgi:hypothetical protein